MTIDPSHKSLQDIQTTLASTLRDLGARVSALHDHLSAESVHSARVASRKVDSAIYLCQDSIRKKDYRFYKRRCKQIRASTNSIRDCDVLLEALPKSYREKGERVLLRNRRVSQQNLQRLVSRWIEHNEFGIRLKHVIERPKPGLGPGIAARTLQLAGRFMVAAMDRPICDHNVHHLRIATKRARYAHRISGCLRMSVYLA